MVTPLPPQPEQKKNRLGCRHRSGGRRCHRSRLDCRRCGRHEFQGGNNDTSVVNEALKAEPANNSTGKEPEQGSVEEVASRFCRRWFLSRR